jgi:SulP family sulfate permease
MRWSAELFFANAGHFQEQVRRLIADAETPPKAVLLDASAITSVDVTGADALAEIIAELEERQVMVMVARARGPVRDMIRSTGLRELVPVEHQFASVREGVEYYHRELAGAD